MASYQTNHIAKIVSAIIKGRQDSQCVEHFLIDSRKLVFPETTLFIAIKTAKRDGHQYIDDLYKRGVRNFLVSSLYANQDYDDALFLLVDDTIEAFQQLAVFHRSNYDFPVIGITGSNGKTIVKEWANHLLHNHYNIVRSPRSYNSQIGVPMSILQMDSTHNLGIFEAGISIAGEMENLEKIIQPTIGLITNIGEAHSEGFDGMEMKLHEKLRLFSNCNTLICCSGHKLIQESVNDLKAKGNVKRVITWGVNENDDVIISSKNNIGQGIQLNLVVNGTKKSIILQHRDHATVENAMHCVALLYALDKLNMSLDAFEGLPPLSMRLEMQEGLNNCLVINDSYNADLSGLQTAVEFMLLQADKRKRAIVMSDISGVAGNVEEVYKGIAAMFRQHEIHRVFGIGIVCEAQRQLFIDKGIEYHSFSSVDTFLASVHPSSFKDEVILLKGSSLFKFDRISQLFEKKLHQTRLEIDLGAVVHNIGLYKQQLKPSTKIMAMVKAFSYGAGSFEIARMLQLQGIDYLAVAYVDEGVELRKAGIDLPIMVMNTEEAAFSALLEYGIEPEIYSLDILQTLSFYLGKEGVSQFPVHIKLDTGMHRLGFEGKDIDQLLELLNTDNTFLVRSVFTHLVSSENSVHDEFTATQSSLFIEYCNKLRETLGYSFLMHASNTAAIARHPQLQYDMVRLGIGMYGVDPGNAELGLIEAATLKTTISQIRNVNKGESVGYGRHAILQRDSRIATVRIGYADGYPRALGNGIGKMLIQARLVPTAGNVCMDMTMLDITDYPEVNLNDEVIVFGKGHSVSSIATEANTIPYEILTGISQRVPRIYFGE